MKWYKVPGNLKPGSAFIKKVKAGNKSICLVSDGTELFALGAKCPHADGDLSMGWCNNQKIVCPIHRYSYDLHTGKGSKGQNDFINTFPVKITDDEIYVGTSSFLDKITELYKK